MNLPSSSAPRDDDEPKKKFSGSEPRPDQPQTERLRRGGDFGTAPVNAFRFRTRSAVQADKRAIADIVAGRKGRVSYRIDSGQLEFRSASGDVAHATSDDFADLFRFLLAQDDATSLMTNSNSPLSSLVPSEPIEFDLSFLDLVSLARDYADDSKRAISNCLAVIRTIDDTPWVSRELYRVLGLETAKMSKEWGEYFYPIMTGRSFAETGVLGSKAKIDPAHQYRLRPKYRTWDKFAPTEDLLITPDGNEYMIYKVLLEQFVSRIRSLIKREIPDLLLVADKTYWRSNEAKPVSAAVRESLEQRNLRIR